MELSKRSISSTITILLSTVVKPLINSVLIKLPKSGGGLPRWGHPHDAGDIAGPAVFQDGIFWHGIRQPHAGGTAAA